MNTRLKIRAIGRPLVYLMTWVFLTSVCRADEGFIFSGLALGPQSRVVPGQVITLIAKAGNVGEHPVRGTVVLTIDEIPNLQSAREVALEPGQSEQYELMMPLPADLAEFEKVHLVGTMLIQQGDQEVILERNGAPAVSTLTLPVNQGKVFGMALEADPPVLPYWYWPPTPPHSSYELASAARIDAGGKRTVNSYEMQSLPLNHVQWNGLDLFIIAEPTPLEDPAAVEAINRFMANGGRTWVMLDKVPSHLVRPLLGIGQSCEAVERVELNDFVIDIDGLASQLVEADRRITSEQDIPMVRVLHSGGEVTHRVEGWPVAITMDVGYGQLFLTTLDSSAWIAPRLQQRSSDPLVQSGYQTRLWGVNLAISANAPRTDLPVSQAVDYPLRLIGNPVVPKAWVALALLGFCGSLAASALWLGYGGRLPLLGMLAPGLALLVSSGLLLAANWVRREIPESVSRLQLVNIGDDGSFALIREQAAVYLSSAADMRLSSEVDGIMLSSAAVSSGVRRLVTEDFHKWHATNSNWPPGAWRYEAEFAIPANQLFVSGHFTPQGLQLRPPQGLPSELQDPVLSFVTGDPLLCDFYGTDLRVNNQIKLDGRNWISGSFISDEQQRRMEIYQQFFQPNNLLQQPTRRLYGWTNVWPTSSWSRELKQQGSALVALPVQLERPAIGQEILIPHGLVQLRRVTTGGSFTSVFNDLTGQWRDDVSMATEADLEFVLPTEAVPLKVTAIDFELDITAPQRTVSVEVITPTGPVEIVRLVNPTIPWKQTITQADILRTIQDGHLPFRVIVGNPAPSQSPLGGSSLVTWHIDYFHATVHGQMLASSSLSQTPSPAETP